MPPIAEPRPPEPSAAPWPDLCEYASALGGVGWQGLSLFWDPHQLRRRWLADLGQAMDRYLRSDAVLDLMELNARTMRRSMSWLNPPSADKR